MQVKLSKSVPVLESFIATDENTIECSAAFLHRSIVDAKAAGVELHLKVLAEVPRRQMVSHLSENNLVGAIATLDPATEQSYGISVLKENTRFLQTAQTSVFMDFMTRIMSEVNYETQLDFACEAVSKVLQDEPCKTLVNQFKKVRTAGKTGSIGELEEVVAELTKIDNSALPPGTSTLFTCGPGRVFIAEAKQLIKLRSVNAGLTAEIADIKASADKYVGDINSLTDKSSESTLVAATFIAKSLARLRLRLIAVTRKADDQFKKDKQAAIANLHRELQDMGLQVYSIRNVVLVDVLTNH